MIMIMINMIINNYHDYDQYDVQYLIIIIMINIMIMIMINMIINNYYDYDNDQYDY